MFICAPTEGKSVVVKEFPELFLKVILFPAARVKMVTPFVSFGPVVTVIGVDGSTAPLTVMAIDAPVGTAAVTIPYSIS